MRLKINRGQVDRALAEMNLFPTLKEEIAKYKEEENKLTDQVNQLKERQSTLQQELTSNLMDRELTDDIGRQVYLNLEGKKINDEIEVISSMLEQLDEKQLELKFRYVVIFKDALNKDYPQVLKYDAVPLIENMRYEALSCLADVSNKMLVEFNEVAPTVFEVFETPEVIEKYPSLHYTFYQGKYVPHFESENPVVISKADVFSAVEAGVVQYQNPNEVKDSEK